MGPVLPGSPQPLAECHDGLLVDLDGVVYVGPHAVAHAAESLAAAAERGAVAAYVTNNASRTPEEVAAHLRELGLAASASDVVTSAQAGARVVATLVPPGSRVLAIGGPGVAAALRERGFEVVASADDSPAAVMQGYGPDVGWRELAEGAFAVRAGARFVATNLDRTFPTPRGQAPGAGSMVQVIRTATGVTPEVAGKPEPPLLLESIDRVGCRRPLVVGDRLDTDIEAAERIGVPSLLVLTGVTGVHELLGAAAGLRPTHVSVDLRGLLATHPVARALAGGGECGAAAVRVEGDELRVEREGDGPLDLLRAAAVTAWAAADVGRTVVPGEVGERLAELGEPTRWPARWPGQRRAVP